MAISILDAFVGIFRGDHDYVIVEQADGGFVQAAHAEGATSGIDVLEVSHQGEVTYDMGFTQTEYGTFERGVHCQSERDAVDVAHVAECLAPEPTNIVLGWW